MLIAVSPNLHNTHRYRGGSFYFCLFCSGVRKKVFYNFKTCEGYLWTKTGQGVSDPKKCVRERTSSCITPTIMVN